MEKNDVGKVTGVDLYNLLGASTISRRSRSDT